MSNITKRSYVHRKITPQVIAQFKAFQAVYGNGTRAIEELEPNTLSAKDRAYRITKKDEKQNTELFIDDQLQRIGIDAVNRLGMLVNSTNEAIATKNVHFSIDHIRGQATKKSINVTGKFNIQNVLD